MLPEKSNRILSIDIVRGFVMIIMALDHVRDFFMTHGLDIDPLALATTTVPLFFTRWVTHFCAPIFVFLSGISAAISLQKNVDTQGKFLIKRGAWLILIEVTVITFALTLNPLFNVIIFQVIWAIGLSLILLGFLHRLSRKLILAVGFFIIFGHDALRYLDLPTEGVAGTLLQMLLTSPGAFIPLGNNYFIAALYAAIPWMGVMFVGYGAGALFINHFPADRRQKTLLLAGAGSILFFIILRFTNLYGDPAPWTQQKTPVLTLLSFISISKYPPSLLYCCLTVGTGMILLGVTERLRNRISSILIAYGRVPFFYYICHFYLIKVFLVILFFATGYTVSEIVNPQMPFLFRPFAFGFSLPVVYLLWITVVALLYVPCLWYWGYKIRHPEKWWTRYV